MDHVDVPADHTPAYHHHNRTVVSRRSRVVFSFLQDEHLHKLAGSTTGFRALGKHSLMFKTPRPEMRHLVQGEVVVTICRAATASASSFSYFQHVREIDV